MAVSFLVGLAPLANLAAQDATPGAVQSAPDQAAPPPVQIEPAQPASGAVIAPVPPTDASAAPADAPPPAAAAPPLDNPVKQTGQVLKDLAKGDIKALRRGPLLIHGNYCGIGNRPGTVPIDALDAACMRHDSCTHTGKMPSCPCDNRLREEALEIAKDPRTPTAIQTLATSMAASMVILICK